MDRLTRPRRSEAALLLLAGAAHNFGFFSFPPEMWGRVYKITGAVFLLVLLAILCLHVASWMVRAVAAVFAGYAIQAAGCDVWYLLAPWPLDPLTPMCSQKLGLPLTTLGLCAVCWAAGSIHRSARES